MVLLHRPHARLAVGIVADRHEPCRARALRQRAAWPFARRLSSGQVRPDLRTASLDVLVESRRTRVEEVDGPRGGGGQWLRRVAASKGAAVWVPCKVERSNEN